MSAFIPLRRCALHSGLLGRSAPVRTIRHNVVSRYLSHANLHAKNIGSKSNNFNGFRNNLGMKILLTASTGVVFITVTLNSPFDWKNGLHKIHCEQLIIEKPIVVPEELAAEKVKDAADAIITPIRNRIIRDILKHLQPDWPLLLAIVTVTIGSAAINIFTPMIIGDLVSVVQSMLGTAVNSSTPVDFSPLNAQALKLLGLFFAQGFLTFIDISLVTKLGENLAIRLRKELYEAILRQDIAFFDAHLQGEVVGRLTQDVADFKHTFKLCITQGLKATTQIFGSAIHLLRISPSLTYTLLATMPFLYLGMNFYGIYLRKLSKKARTEDGIAAGVANEAVANLRTVRAFAAESREIEKYLEAVENASAANLQLGFHIGAFQGMTNTSIGTMILLILYYGGNQVARGEMTGGQLMAYMVATQNAQRSLASVGVLFGQALKALTSAGRVLEYIDQKSIIPIKGGLIPKSLKGTIEFKDVNFSYPTRPDAQILNNFSLTIPSGSVVALCGASGSGKSTVGQLIERFYEPNNGKVLLDGVDIRELDPSWLRENVGYINQEPVLFATTIYENIRYGRPDATHQEILDAARQANASEFIESFPKGYDTMVGERGVTLSGGQKQRIAIARAILKNPTCLLLDEATSALDTQSEKAVQQALDYIMKGRTTLVIAHRLSTIQNADLIVVMSGHGKSERKTGNIVETGTHRELLAKRGAYYRLYNQLQADQ